MLDCLIIGSGPAGVSAALTLKANGKSFVLFGSEDLSEKIVKAERIENYPGLSSVSGRAFCDALKEQLTGAGIQIETKRVTGVYAMKDSVSVSLEGGEVLSARTAILCCGVETVKQIDGEAEFLGRGVSYCATCDGFLYKGKSIAVISTSERFEHEVLYLADLAEKVYFIPLYKNVAVEKKNVLQLKKAPKRVEGARRVERLVFFGKTEESVQVDGVFMLKDSISPSALVGGLATENGHVLVDRNMRTNLKRIFAAGDVTGRPYQYAKAVGEGNVAAHAVCDTLKEEK